MSCCRWAKSITKLKVVWEINCYILIQRCNLGVGYFTLLTVVASAVSKSKVQDCRSGYRYVFLWGEADLVTAVTKNKQTATWVAKLGSLSALAVGGICFS